MKMGILPWGIWLLFRGSFEKRLSDLLFVQTWGQVLKKRGLLTLIWAVGAAVVSLLAVLIF